jgi:hypothetical protein
MPISHVPVPGRQIEAKSQARRNQSRPTRQQRRRSSPLPAALRKEITRLARELSREHGQRFKADPDLRDRVARFLRSLLTPVTGLEKQSRPLHSSPTEALTAPTVSWTPGFPTTSGLYWNRAWACLGRKAEWGAPLSEPVPASLSNWGKLRAANVTRCSTKSRNPYPVTGAQVIAAPNRPRPPARARFTRMLRDATRNQEIRAL